MKQIQSTALLRLFRSSLRLGLALSVAGVFATTTFAADTAKGNTPEVTTTSKSKDVPKDTYYINDPLATTVATSDAAGEIAQIEADAFGAPINHGGQPVRYTGKPYDEDIGAYIFPFRNYRPEEARWMTPDPSGFPDGVNGGAYNPNPLSQFDPLGLRTVNWTWNETSQWINFSNTSTLIGGTIGAGIGGAITLFTGFAGVITIPISTTLLGGLIGSVIDPGDKQLTAWSVVGIKPSPPQAGSDEVLMSTGQPIYTALGNTDGIDATLAKTFFKNRSVSISYEFQPHFE